MMRPIFATVMMVAACGDNMVVVDDLQEAPAPADDTGFEEPLTRFVPDACGARTWPTVAVDGRDVDLSVVPTAGGASIFAVARTGGPLRGFQIDGRGLLVGKAQGMVIRDDAAFTAVAAAYVDERLVTASVSDGTVSIDLVRPDLGGFATLGTARGSLIADLPIARVPFAHEHESRLATIGTDTGVTALAFDASWQASGTLTVADKPPLTMTAAPYLLDTMVAWSTESSCHLQRVAAERTSTRPFPCLDARLAMNVADGTGRMVFVKDDRVMVSEIVVGGESEIANDRVLVASARAPRIAFDGSRYWVSYIDAHDDVVVGYLQDDGTLAELALEGTQPFSDAYELAIVNSGVWVFAVDGDGVGAQRVCLKPIY